MIDKKRAVPLADHQAEGLVRIYVVILHFFFTSHAIAPIPAIWPVTAS